MCQIHIEGDLAAIPPTRLDVARGLCGEQDVASATSRARCVGTGRSSPAISRDRKTYASILDGPNWPISGRRRSGFGINPEGKAGVVDVQEGEGGREVASFEMTIYPLAITGVLEERLTDRKSVV